MKALDRFTLIHHRLTPTAPIIVEERSYSIDEGHVRQMHFATEMGVLVSGRLRRTYRGAIVDCAAGDVWFCGSFEPHGFEVLQEPCEAVVFITSAELLARMQFPEDPGFDPYLPYTVPPGHRPRLDDRDRETVLDAVRRARLRSTGSVDRPNAWPRILLVEIAMTLASRWRAPASRRRLSNPDLATVTRAMDVIMANMRFVPVAEVAQDCGVSRSVLSRLFSEHAGIGLSEYALRHRLSCVADRLLFSDDPLKHLCEEYGFSDASHLHRVFKGHYGCTPGEYRSRQRLHSRSARPEPSAVGRMVRSGARRHVGEWCSTDLQKHRTDLHYRSPSLAAMIPTISVEVKNSCKEERV